VGRYTAHLCKDPESVEVSTPRESIAGLKEMRKRNQWGFVGADVQVRRQRLAVNESPCQTDLGSDPLMADPDILMQAQAKRSALSAVEHHTPFKVLDILITHITVNVVSLKIYSTQEGPLHNVKYFNY
jgi:hypothetical protein